jgi:hypothetical protein
MSLFKPHPSMRLFVQSADHYFVSFPFSKSTYNMDKHAKGMIHLPVVSTTV